MSTPGRPGNVPLSKLAKMRWSPEAKSAGREIVLGTAIELWGTAEKIAVGHSSDEVGAGHVRIASERLGIARREPWWLEAGLGFGYALFGLAGGGLITAATAGEKLGNLGWLSIVGFAVSLILVAVGLTVRVMLRRTSI